VKIDLKKLVMHEPLSIKPPEEAKPKADSTLRRYVHKDFAKFGRAVKEYLKRKSKK
jgi:hypothetical protein